MRIERNGQAVEVETRKASALLAYLALHPESLSRDQLATLLWPESAMPADGGRLTSCTNWLTAG